MSQAVLSPLKRDPQPHWKLVTTTLGELQRVKILLRAVDKLDGSTIKFISRWGIFCLIVKSYTTYEYLVRHGAAVVSDADFMQKVWKGVDRAEITGRKETHAGRTRPLAKNLRRGGKLRTRSSAGRQREFCFQA